MHLPKSITAFKGLILLSLVAISALLTLGSCTKVETVTNDTSSAAVRGVWLTNVASDALYSRENIKEAVETCNDLGFNSIFVVTWNKGYTIYQSQIMDSLFGESIIPDLAGRDPLQELIEEAKPYGIKVFAWFEFGFASSISDPTGGHLIQKFPRWASRDIDGKITEKNDFQWMNPFHPEVQGFIKSLVSEVVQNYEIDGIQGDDRLPALPSNGGYSDFTKELYASEHSGKNPPAYAKDFEWVKWRSRKLSLFLEDLVSEVKSLKPDLIISMAPSIYEWSEENYLQDWPKWLDMKLVDLVIPQVYRYQLGSYAFEMNKIKNEQLGFLPQESFVPGVLLQVNDYNPEETLLNDFIQTNRDLGFNGEVFFFYEGIKKFPDYFKKTYGKPIPFPEFNTTSNKFN
jgi:uncharacterized lipoprotein YddW (UPF0748 family)